MRGQQELRAHFPACTHVEYHGEQQSGRNQDCEEEQPACSNGKTMVSKVIPSGIRSGGLSAPSESRNHAQASSCSRSLHPATPPAPTLTFAWHLCRFRRGVAWEVRERVSLDFEPMVVDVCGFADRCKMSSSSLPLSVGSVHNAHGTGDATTRRTAAGQAAAGFTRRGQANVKSPRGKQRCRPSKQEAKTWQGC